MSKEVVNDPTSSQFKDLLKGMKSCREFAGEDFGVTLRWITPKDAEKILGYKAPNRCVSKQRVLYYAQ